MGKTLLPLLAGIGTVAGVAGIGVATGGFGLIPAAGGILGAASAGEATAASVLAGVAGAGSALATIGGGFAAAHQAKTQALYEDYQAKAAELEGRKQAVTQLEGFNRVQAAQVAAIGASGIGYEGSPIKGLEVSATRAAQAHGLIENAAQAGFAAHEGQARAYREQGTMDILGGFLGAAGIAANMGLSALKRGSVPTPKGDLTSDSPYD